MTTRSSTELTDFGIWLKKRELSYQAAADALGLTRQHVQMIATNKAGPSLLVAGQIEKWTRALDPKDPVLMTSWLP